MNEPAKTGKYALIEWTIVDWSMDRHVYGPYDTELEAKEEMKREFSEQVAWLKSETPPGVTINHAESHGKCTVWYETEIGRETGHSIRMYEVTPWKSDYKIN